jgi:titin
MQQRTATVLNQSIGDGSTPLAGGATYQVRVHAVNALGTGQDSDTVTASLPAAGSPGAPTAVTGAPDATGKQIKVDFTAPAPGDTAIVKYQYSTDNGRTWSDTATAAAGGGLHADLSNESGTGFQLYPGQQYRVRLRAVNTQGPGLPSAAAEVTLPPAAPGRMYRLSVLARAQGGFAVSFDSPPDNGSQITGWEYTTDNGAHWRALTGVTGDMQQQRTATVLNQSTGDGTAPLAGGATYQVRIRALNAVGTGEDSDAVAAYLPNAGSPAAPGGVTAAPAAGDHIGVDFTAPDQGDTAIIKYQYSTDDGNTWRDTATTGTGPLHADLTRESGGDHTFGHGNTYSVRVRAVNTQGPGLPSAAAEVGLPPAAPGEPFDLRALAGSGSMALAFKAPSDNGRQITAFQYSTDDGAHWQPLTGVTGDWRLTATITEQSTGDGTTSLVAGATYQLRVRAINEIGTGQDSQTVAAALPNPGSPAAPGPVTATPAGDTIGVDFAAPGQGNSPILKYQYSTDDGGTWADIATTGTTTLHAAITGSSRDGYPLHPGEPYGVRLRAVNTQGPGLPSAAAEVSLPPTAPGEPFDLLGDPGDGTIGLSWDASDNGDEITGYTYSTNDGTDWRPLSPFAFSKDDWTTSATITAASTGDGGTPLQNGQTYQIRLRATNSIGTGPDSQPLTVQLPLPGSPGRPADLTVAPAGDTIGVDVTAPGQGNSAITKYQYSTDGGGTWRDLTTTGTGSLHAAISVESGSGLVLGHDNRYLVRVRAVNGQGAGLPSAPAGISLPASAPGKPAGITPVPGNRQVTFTFSVNANGPDLTGIEYSTDNGVTWRALNVEDVTQLDKMHFSTTITNVSSGGGTARLANGVTYQLRLRATNDLGTGPAADAVNFIPAADLAGAPAQVTATAGDRRITVTYQVADDGGSPATGLRYSTDGGTTWADATPTGTGTLTAVITRQSTGDGTTPLVNGVPIALLLRLLTSAGAGAPGAAVTATPFTVPDAPGGLTAKPAKDGAALQFSTPGTGGSAITGYDYSTDGGATWAAMSPSGTGTLSATVTTASGAGRPALTNGTTYQIAVRARNVAGNGGASATAALTLTSLAGAPVSLAATARNRSAELTFRPPADTGGTAITGYQVSTDDGASWAALGTQGAGTLTATVAGLVNGTAYQIRVRAVTAAGQGAVAGPVTVTPLAAPAAPSGVVATAKTATITVTWVASPAGGAPVTGYTAIASPGPATCDTTGATTCVLGAQADQAYTVTVVAHSASGDSTASGPSDSVSAASPVIPPTPPVTDEQLDTPTDDDSTTAPGATITLKGSGYAPNSTVELIVYSSPVSLGTVLTDGKGEFSVDVVVPPSLPVGDHTLAAVGADKDGNVRAMRLDVTVAPAVPATPTTPTTSPPLAITGTATVDQAELGLLMLLIGAGLVRASRTRRWHPRHRDTPSRSRP